MSNNPKVSVILTSFNHGRFIGDTIDSILGQSFRDFELIIADDCSQDNSWEIITSYQDSRIKLFKSDVSERGLINKVLKRGLATGEYIAIHHSDDLWEPEKLEKQVAFLNQWPEYGAVFTRVKTIDETGNVSEEHSISNRTQEYYLNVFDQENRTRHEWLRRFFYEGNCLCHPSALLRKECFEKIGYYNPFFRQLPDFDFWVRLCLSYEIHILPERLVKFRLHGNESNTSSATDDNVRRSIYEFFAVLNHFRKIKDSDFLLKIFPEMEKDLFLPGCFPEYCLAQAALKGNHRSIIFFGILLLDELMGNEEIREKIKKTHNFTLADYHKVTGSIDLFNELNVVMLNTRIAEMNNQAEALAENMAATNQEKLFLQKKMEEMTMSRSWKITAPLRFLDRAVKNIFAAR